MIIVVIMLYDIMINEGIRVNTTWNIMSFFMGIRILTWMNANMKYEKIWWGIRTWHKVTNTYLYN